MLELKNVTVSVGKKKILKNVTASFKKGKVYAIMGPNGSGKSTLANIVMGHPLYSLSKESKISFLGNSIAKVRPDVRAKQGIFLSYQTPQQLSGVTIYNLMRYALAGTKDPLTIRQEVQTFAKKLHISEDLLTRSLNDGFSGGEKKKMEVLQAAMLHPRIMFFDEIDTGVDIDALKTIASFIKGMKNEDTTFVLITHYNRILKYIQPDEVLVMVQGEIVKRGDKSLPAEIEKHGYGQE